MLNFFVNDLFPVLKWWTGFSLFGIIFWPFVASASPNSIDKGFYLSKVLGFLVFSYLVWFLSHLRILSFTKVSILFAIFAVLLIIFRYRKILNYDFGIFKSHLRILFWGESFYLVVFIFFSFLRTSNPIIPQWGDAFSDLAYISSIVKSSTLPPKDPWFAGEFINYYYYGYYLTAFLSKLCDIKASISYNLMKATLFSLSFCMPVALTANLLLRSGKLNTGFCLILGFMSSFLVCFGGSFHTLIYAFVLPLAKKTGIFEGSVDEYFYVHPTRYVEHTITEFPAYSLIVNDLHPNGLCIPIAISMIMISWWWVDEPRKFSSSRFGLSCWLILPAFLLSIIFMTNSWGYPIYSLVIMLSVFYVNLKSSFFKALCHTFYQGFFILVVSVLFSYPFLYNFQSMTEGIGIVSANTPLIKFIIYWGYQLFFILTFFFVLLFKYFRSGDGVEKDISAPNAWTAMMMIAGFLVLLFPEIFYVVDFYSGENHRMNTLWKFWHEAFLIISCTIIYSCYVILKFISAQRLSVSSFAGVVIMVFLVSPFLYPLFSLPQLLSFPNNMRYQGLDGISAYYENSSNYVEAANWLNSNVKNQVGILEAPAPSFSGQNLVSTLTGLPTIFGWDVHVSLHHIRKGDKLNNARAFIKSISESNSPDLIKSSLKLFNVKYVILGKNELSVFGESAVRVLRSLGPVVFTRSHNDESIDIVELE
ncbi:MAG TPA: DUF2298 domain-containing protein [Oligoflexia bacterium]|nr:DUF2298 domain-containing protein [Oligoflexia bacterium]HMP48582.1 DUF2298 domain-containing protein [Oligoflexia bacterium]